MCDLFGGPSKQEIAAQDATTQLNQSLMANYQQQYAEQQGALTNMQAQIARLQSGDTGPGFGGDENAARISYIKNLYAAQARNEAQASRERGAGTQATQGAAGGQAGSIASRAAGINKQTDLEALSRSQAGESNALLQEQAENYAAGRQKVEKSIDAWGALAGKYSPTSYSSEAESGLGTQFNEARTIQQEKQQRAANIMKFGTQLALGAATFGAGGIGALGAGESFGEGVGDFLKGGMNETFGTNFGINS